MRTRLLCDTFAVVSLAVFVAGLVNLAISDRWWVLFTLGSIGAMVMWGWMVADCIAELAHGRQRGLIVWLAVMLPLWPLSWAYYFAVRRRRVPA